MTATKTRLGRDPQLHEIHDGVLAADGYRGRRGEITLTADGSTGKLVELRVHDGFQLGGYLVQVEDTNTVTAMLPNAKVVSPVEHTAVGSDTLTINHQLGYYPLVQVLDMAGSVVQDGSIGIDHDDIENVTLSFSTAGDFTILMR